MFCDCKTENSPSVHKSICRSYLDFFSLFLTSSQIHLVVLPWDPIRCKWQCSQIRDFYWFLSNKNRIDPSWLPERPCSSQQIHQEEVLIYGNQLRWSEQVIALRYSHICLSVCVSHSSGSFLFFLLRWWRFIYSALHVPRIDVTAQRRRITACLTPVYNPH